MSCNLNKICSLNDLKSLKQILIPNYQSIQERNRDDDYDNRWNWQTSQVLESTTDDNTEWMSFLLTSLVSISPLVDMIAFAKTRYLAVYKLKTLSDHKSIDNSSDNNFRELELSFDTQLLSGLNSTEVITSILFVPIVGQQKSSSFAFHDWTALLVGFSSGYFRVYTENGKLLLSQLLHNESIVDIKCQTFRSNSSSNDCDLILVVYNTSVVLIDGLSLYQTLRFCRNQLAKNQSISNGPIFGATDNSHLSFTYKKWKLEVEDKGMIRDCHHIEFGARNQWDHMLSHNMDKGPYAPLKINSSSAHLLITCGENPFVGFYRAHEDQTPILNKLTQDVVNKVKNMIPLSGLFGSSKPANEPQKIEASTPVPLRIGLWDQRLGTAISISPNRKLAAVIDDYGRVTLIDVHKWVAIRMWKGYREAQVGWVEASEEPNPGPLTKRVLFLVIYAPKRGILEIWCTQMGPRVGAFNVGKTCKLFQSQHTMMGLNALLIRQFKDISEIERSRCFLFDFSTGDLYDIKIPFLCALTDGNSKKTRDLHLLKELQQLFQNSGKTINSEKVVELVVMLKTADVRRDALKEICLLTDIEIIETTTKELKNHLMSNLEKNELDFENKLIAQMCCRVIQLCHFFKRINSKQNNKNNYLNESSNPPDIQYLEETLSWTGSDIVRVVSLIAFKEALNKCDTISGDKQNVVTIADILSNFILYSNHIHKVDDKEVYENIPIELNVNLSDNKSLNIRFLALSHFIFSPFLRGNDPDIENLFKMSGILSSNLLILIFISWLSSDYCNYWKCWQYFCQTLNILLKNLKLQRSDLKEISEEENEWLSDDWNQIIEIIYDSNNIMAALIAVHMIKAINIKEKNQNKSISDGSDEWETLNIDNESLIQIIRQLEDVFLLDMLLRSKLDEDIGNERQTSDNLKISLSHLLQSGPGIVSELVAKWAISSNIKADALYSIIGEQMDVSEATEDIDDINVGVEAIEYKNIDFKSTSELLEHVRRCFPNCLESDVLLVNCCWELMVRWNKEPSVIDNSLDDSLEFLNYVSSAVLKHNFGCLLWKTFILKRFESLSLLMEKMGKTPKDRICMKEMGIHENRIEAFVDYSHRLLDLILNSSMMAEMEPMPLFSVDDWWKSQSNQSVNQSVPLVILAVNQKLANGALILEQSRLASVLQFIVTFQMKSSKPLSLFASVVKQYLFKELHTFPVCSNSFDTVLNEKRTEFLLNVVSAIVQTLPVQNENESDYFVNQSQHYSQANQWFGKVLTLCREWDLNLDTIRRKYVHQLYFHGCDPLAQETLTSVINVELLGSELLSVAGMRVVTAINAKYGSVEQMHTLPTNVMFWLKNLNMDSHCYCGSSSSATLALLQHISNFVFSDKTNSRICETLIETIKILNP